jgi:hypothetical protein
MGGDIMSHNALKTMDFDEDPFTEKWARVVKDNPTLEDNFETRAQVNFKGLFDAEYANLNKIKTYGARIKRRRNYTDNRKDYSKYFPNNESRKVGIIGNINKWQRF